MPMIGSGFTSWVAGVRARLLAPTASVGRRSRRGWHSWRGWCGWRSWHGERGCCGCGRQYGYCGQRDQHDQRGFTIYEVIIAFALLLMLLIAAYRVFFAEVRSMRSAFEHMGVNENARRFIAQFGNDVRNANFLLEPFPVARESVAKLLPTDEGVVCRLERQSFAWEVKPPDPALLKAEKITYRLERDKFGVSSLYRESESDIPPFPGASVPFKARRKVCGGIRDMLVYTTLHRPAKLSSFAGLPYKNLLVYDPYELNGHGPRLLHVRMTLVREGRSEPPTANEISFPLRSCFAIRGRLNGVNP